MTEGIHPLAPHHLPRYLAGADGNDPLFTLVTVLLVVLLLVVGNFYLKLHALPERLAHRRNNTQLQIIMVLALLALFTHNNVLWVAALLLAVVELPDYATPLRTMADSLEKMAAKEDDSSASAPPPPAASEPAPSATAAPREEV